MPDAGSGDTAVALSDPGDRLEQDAERIASRIERPGSERHPGARAAANAADRMVSQSIVVQRQPTGTGAPTTTDDEPYTRGYADGLGGLPASPLLLYNDEALKSYQWGWQLGRERAERRQSSTALTQSPADLGPGPVPDFLRQSPSPMSASVAGNTTDVAWPPDRPDISVPTRLPVVVAGAQPPADEAVPDLGIDTTVPFWGLAEVSQYAFTLVGGWEKRSASAHPAEKAPTIDDLVKDFDESMQGWYARSSFGATWEHLGPAILSQLKSSRAKFAKDLAQPHGRTPGLKGADLDAAVEANMVVARQNVIDRVHSHLIEGAWGWMVERRNHLDFATLSQQPWLAKFDPAPLFTSQEERSAIHAAADAAGKSLTADEVAKVLKDAEDAKRKALAAKRKVRGSSAPPATDQDPVLTDEEKQNAITSKEKAKLGPQAVKDTLSKLKAAKLEAEQSTWVDVHERDDQGNRKWGNAWEEAWKKVPDKDDKKKTRLEFDPKHSSTGVMRKTAELILKLEKATGGGFTVANYGGHGLGSFEGRGRSVDINIGKREASGFFEPQAAVTFLLTLASVADVEWRVLYDDYRVAKAVNDKLGKRRVVETANTFRDKTNTITSINWHGPLVTHFHLDLAY